MPDIECSESHKQELFGYLDTELDCIALDSQLDDIYHICNKERIKQTNAYNKLENAFRDLLNKTITDKDQIVKNDWLKEAGLTL